MNPARPRSLCLALAAWAAFCSCATVADPVVTGLVERTRPDGGAVVEFQSWDGRTEEIRMSIRIGVNGFGRMGRLALRAAWGWPGLQFVHINELKGGPEAAAHLLAFDSVHGRWDHDVRAGEDAVLVDGTAIGFSACANPGEVPWSRREVDIVLECSGKLRSPELLAPYFENGVKKVIVAAPVKEGALNVVVGVNDHEYRPDRHHLVTAASCTTNCLAPLVKVVHEGIGIEHGIITTIHDITNTQVVVDAPHKDLRRARASGMSLIRPRPDRRPRSR